MFSRTKNVSKRKYFNIMILPLTVYLYTKVEYLKKNNNNKFEIQVQESTRQTT